MIQREIRKAISGKSFFYNDDETGKKVPCEPCESHVFDHYYKIWDDFHVLGILPHGKGTLSERRWVIEIIKTFEKAHGEVVNFIREKSEKRAAIQARNRNH